MQLAASDMVIQALGKPAATSSSVAVADNPAPATDAFATALQLLLTGGTAASFRVVTLDGSIANLSNANTEDAPLTDALISLGLGDTQSASPSVASPLLTGQVAPFASNSNPSQLLGLTGVPVDPALSVLTALSQPNVEAGELTTVGSTMISKSAPVLSQKSVSVSDILDGASPVTNFVSLPNVTGDFVGGAEQSVLLQQQPSVAPDTASTDRQTTQTQHVTPNSANELVGQFDLDRGSFSKYTRSVDVMQTESFSHAPTAYGSTLV